MFHIRLNFVEHVTIYSSLSSQLLHRSRRCLLYCHFSCAPPIIVSISSILDCIVIPWWNLHSRVISWNVSFPAIVVLRLSILSTPGCRSKVVNCTDTWRIENRIGMFLNGPIMVGPDSWSELIKSKMDKDPRGGLCYKRVRGWCVTDQQLNLYDL